LCGALIGSIGAVIHAVTAFAIRFDMTAGNRPLPPSEWMANWGTPLLVCWVIVIAAAVVAAIVIARIALSSGSPIPRVLGVLNPVVISVALIAVGLESEVGQAFLVPAAPNIAHVLFFFLAAVTASSFGEHAGR